MISLGETSDWYDLNTFLDSVDLGIIPSEFWLLHTFYIPLKHRDKTYLVIEYPSYARNNAGAPCPQSECIWSTPYLASKIETGFCKHSAIGRIREFFSQFSREHADLLQQRIEAKFYHMGISYRDMHSLPDVFELKKSPREPDKWKCYLVKRFLVGALDPLGKLNLVDPECLMPYRYLSLTDYKKLLIVPDSTRPYHRFFRGKPISTNVTYLFQKGEVELLREHATEVRPNDFCYREDGLILSFDLNSFGKSYGFVEANFRTFELRGKEIAREFLVGIDEIFQRNLDVHGYFQCQIEGDGFLCSCPQRHFPAPGSETERFAGQISRTVNLIKQLMEDINYSFGVEGMKFGARAVLLRDEYYFGKTGGLHSVTAGHTGKSLIMVSRMQDASREWIKTKGESDKLYLFVPPELLESVIKLESIGCKQVDRFETKQKETDLIINVFQII